MTGGLIQLVARGPQDMFLTEKPQITFFKVVYRRHTNFSIEQVPQSFLSSPNFGKKVSCHIQRSGDLIGDIFIVLTLPQIPQLYNTNGTIDTLTRFAWIRKIGYGIINQIEIEIGGQLIDRHYGEWLNIWSELNRRDSDVNNMIGNVPELYNFSNTKNEYKLFIPLQFWFCGTSGLALPILCLQYNDVKLNLELSDVNDCYLISPTHYITMENDLVNFTKDEYITQTIGTNVAIGRFSYFDNVTKRLYYTQISNDKFLAINDSNFYNYTSSQQTTLISKYSIVGQTSNYSACPTINISDTTVVPVAYTYNTYKNIRVSNCFLLVDYIFLDEDERLKFYKANHEYIIEQLIYTGETSLDGVNRSVKTGLENPCKLMVWTTQLEYIQTNNDRFNYTDSPIYVNDKQIGNSIMKNAIILFNGHSRVEMRDNLYYNYAQPLQYFKYTQSNGIFIYSFGLDPSKNQPAGSCNMSKIDNIQISVQLANITPQISQTNTVKFRCYGLVVNVFRVISGLGGVVFTN
jgi:hypothetical protein